MSGRRTAAMPNGRPEIKEERVCVVMVKAIGEVRSSVADYKAETQAKDLLPDESQRTGQSLPRKCPTLSVSVVIVAS